MGVGLMIDKTICHTMMNTDGGDETHPKKQACTKANTISS